jgi:hypothetical protein
LLSDHLYQAYRPGEPSVNWAYDLFWGLRTDGSNQWLAGVPEDSIGYLEGTGILRVVQHHGALQIEQHWFMPFGVEAPALVSLARITNTGAAPLPDTAAFLLLNLHLGSGASGTTGESIAWDAARQAFVETGRNGAPAAIYRALPAPTRHGAGPGAGPDNPYQRVLAGQELQDVDASGPLEDLVAGFQFDVPGDGVLQPGQSFWAAALVVLSDLGGLDQLQAVLDQVLAGAQPRDLLLDQLAFWDDWHQKDRLPSGLSVEERALARLALVWLKLAQVREPTRDGGKPFGQILASLPPGQWNVSWARDAAYSVLALARSGHSEEARAGLQFMLDGDAGHYAAQVGMPYAISVCRYFGSGLEESDENADGPNIEFDDFGLFLLALEGAWEAAPDPAFLQTAWPIASALVADVLLFLQEPASGLLKPDSSIWERHWNGQQKHFSYSSGVGAAGLCSAARLAAAADDPERERRYREAAARLQAGIRDELLDGQGRLAGNLEELELGQGYADAAAVEGFLQGVLPASDPSAPATFAWLDGQLSLGNGGLFRNDDGSWYDAQEWVFVDLRMAALAFLLGEGQRGEALLGRITRLATENLGLFPELFEAGSDRAAGAIPMAGFGAGAYLLALWARAAPVPREFCGSAVTDGGPDGRDGGFDGGGELDGGADGGSDPGGDRPGAPGCGCGASANGAGGWAWPVVACAWLRRRSSGKKA